VAIQEAGHQATLVLQEPPDYLGTRVLAVSLDIREFRVIPDSVDQEFQDTREHLAYQDIPECLESVVILDSLVSQAIPDLECPVTVDLEFLVTVALAENLDIPVTVA
jgi:hypothetical protein